MSDDLSDFAAKLVRDGVKRHLEETERLGMAPMFSLSEVAELLKAAGVKAFSAHNGVKLRDVLNTTVAIKLGKLRNTTNPAPQEKNSAPLLSGGESVKTNTPTDELVGGTQHGVGAPSGSTKHTLGKEDAHG